MRLAYLILLIVLLTVSNEVNAQNQRIDTVSVNYNQAKISEMVSDLEFKTGFHFYYDSISTDSLRITFTARQKKLSEILEQCLNNKGFYFAISDKSVIISKAKQIQTDLAEGYEMGNGANGQQLQTKQQDFETLQQEKQAAATTENKIYEIGLKTNDLKPGLATLAGYLRDLKTGEPIAGANIYETDSKVAAISDQFGFYSITLPVGKHILTIKAPNTKETKRQLMLYTDGKLNIELQEQVLSLRTVNILSAKTGNVRSLEMGVTRLDIKAIKQVPSVFGEPDILRVVLTLPGVQSVGEASTGFNVRGGSADQNLILLNDATIYNPSHFFGFFSAFNPDVVKDVQLYKSSIPEKFGGRLSSVLEVTNREGNKKKFSGTAGIGLITSRLSIEGPIDSNKTSFIFGARTTYSNWLLKLLPAAYEDSKASFTDANLGLSHQINEKNNLYFSGYFSVDNFKLNSDTAYHYSNKNATLKWKHDFNNRFYGVLALGADRYSYNINSDATPIKSYALDFNINQFNFKTDLSYFLSSNHTINFGLTSIYYKLHPGDFRPIGSQSLIKLDIMPAEQALESAIFVGDKYDIGNNFSISAGLRYSLYNYLGPQTINNYADNLPKTEYNVLNTTSYGSNKLIKTYQGPEVRLSARYNLTKDFSVKASYNTLRQYIHLLSNTTAIAPTDVWKLSDPNIKPQFGDQISLGFYKNFKSGTIETSVEGYYKNLTNYLDYKSGATLVLNHHIETDVVGTKGKAYGVEFFVKKNAGKLNGWMSYAYSRTLLKMDDPLSETQINRGEYYPANYDKPHSFNFTGNYKFKHRYSMSINVTYSTGRPITLPIAKYTYAGAERVYYSDRNAYRIPDYFRTDISFNLEGNHKVKQLTHNSWTVGIYNVTGRKNAYSTYFTLENNAIKGYKLSIFAAMLPFVNYNIRF